MVLLGDKLIEFFNIKDGDEIIYPGVGPLKSAESYEVIFENIFKEIKRKRNTLKIGLVISDSFKRPEYDKLLKVSVFSYTIRGLLFIPNISRWIPTMEASELAAVTKFLGNVKKGGLLLYDVKENIIIAIERHICDSTENFICERIISRRLPGNHLMIKQIT